MEKLRLLVIWLTVALFPGCIALPALANSGIGSRIGGNAVNLGPCASGYTRLQPNYCARNSEFASHSASTFASCTQLNALSGVTNAKAVMYRVEIRLRSANSAGTNNQLTLGVYAPTDTTCSGSAQLLARHAVTEEVAASNIQLALLSQAYLLRTGTTGRTYVQGLAIGGAHTVEFYVMGYFD